jgi:predicted ribosomally synthesized peptide with SipW-like signal peptide
MKKIGILALTLVLALGALGIGYAKWSDTVTINGNVQTGDVQFCAAEEGTFALFTSDECGSGHKDAGALGTTCNPLHLGSGQPVPPKDVACTDANWIDCHTLSITVTNGYPFYTAGVDFTVCNNGTIPIKIWQLKVTDPSGQVHYFYDSPITTGVDLDGDGVCDLVLYFGDNFGDQLEPGDCVDESMGFVLLEEIAEGQTDTLTFTIELTAVQWNEYSKPVPD